MTITAVFGDDEITPAALDCVEGVDVCALDGTYILAAELVMLEASDGAAIGVTVTGIASLECTERADVTTITGFMLLTATIALTDSADNCAIGAIAPTSIFGHGKKFKIRPHAPSATLIVTNT